MEKHIVKYIVASWHTKTFLIFERGQKYISVYYICHFDTTNSHFSIPTNVIYIDITEEASQCDLSKKKEKKYEDETGRRFAIEQSILYRSFWRE